MTFRVANVICRFNSASGGPPRTILAIGEAAVGNWRVELFTTDFIESSDDALLTPKFKGHVNLMSASAQTALGGAMRACGAFRSYEAQLLRGVAPELIHIHGLWSPLLAAFAKSAYRNRIPYIVAPHGMLEPWSLRAHRWRKQAALSTYQGRIFERAAGIHATSDAEADNVRALGLVSCPIFVIPNAVDSPNQLRRRVREPGGRKTLLFLSRVHEKKGLDMLLRAWNETRPASWDLQIVGSGQKDYVDRLKRFCLENGMSNVTFRPHVDADEREAAYEGASAFILPTYSENFGNVVPEAWLRGLPVITTTGTPWSEIRERNLGWYVTPDVEAFKRVLAQLETTSDAELENMGARGRDYALRNFSADAVRERLRTMYSAAISPTSVLRLAIAAN